MTPELVVYWYYRKVSQGQQAENQRQPVVNFTHFLILNPDDLMQGTNEPNGTQSTGARDVWYIKPPDTLTGVFLFVENNIYHEVGG